MYRIMVMKQKVKEAVGRLVTKKHRGVDGILVCVGLCIVALVLCVVLNDSLSTFITSLVGSMTTKAQGILGT